MGGVFFILIFTDKKTEEDEVIYSRIYTDKKQS